MAIARTRRTRRRRKTSCPPDASDGTGRPSQYPRTPFYVRTLVPRSTFVPPYPVLRSYPRTPVLRSYPRTLSYVRFSYSRILKLKLSESIGFEQEQLTY